MNLSTILFIHLFLADWFSQSDFLHLQLTVVVPKIATRKTRTSGHYKVNLSGTTERMSLQRENEGPTHFEMTKRWNTGLSLVNRPFAEALIQIIGNISTNHFGI